jgi:hypothetical protein
MSGNYQNWNADAPGGLNESAAAVAAGLNQAYAAVQGDQQSAHDFFVASGPSVVSGHPQVRRPGAQGDPDPQLDASDG